MGAGFASFRLAAAGSTTALAFDPNGADGRLGVAIARGGGPLRAGAAPDGRPSATFVLQPFSPSVAVDRAGDVLLAYTLGFNGDAVHATERRAGSARFTSPRVLSTLGHGGVAVAALLSDRTPARRLGRRSRRRALHDPPRRPAPRPQPAASTVTLLPAPRRGCARRNTRGRPHPLLGGLPRDRSRDAAHADAAGSIVGAGERILRAGVSVVKRFEFDPAARAGRARDGSILRVTIDVENASGASREKVVQIRLR